MRILIDGVNLPYEFVTQHTTVDSFVKEFTGVWSHWNDDKLREVYKIVSEKANKKEEKPGSKK